MTWLFLILGLVANTHVCSGGLTHAIANLLLKQVENEVLPARSALGGFASAVADINRDVETRRGTRILSTIWPKMNLYGKSEQSKTYTTAADVCNKMSETLKEADRRAADFAYYIFDTSVNKLSPELQTVLRCEMKNPLLWLKCVYLGVKEVLQTIKSMRQPIDVYVAVLNQLKFTLKAEYEACKRNPFQ